MGVMAHSRETEITFDSVRDKNVMQLRKINTSIFPVRYSDKYYTEAIAGGEFTKLGETQSIRRPLAFLFAQLVLSIFAVYFSAVFTETAALS